jgi:WhiB family redox-sensing transcriptional regulator
MAPVVLSERVEAQDLSLDIRSLASCNDPETDWTSVFFSEDLYDIARAKHLCNRCAVKDDCLAGALERREPWGVWGGELFLNGHVVAIKRRRGRPPKNRPAEVIFIDGEEVVVVPATA